MQVEHVLNRVPVDFACRLHQHDALHRPVIQPPLHGTRLGPGQGRELTRASAVTTAARQRGAPRPSAARRRRRRRRRRRKKKKKKTVASKPISVSEVVTGGSPGADRDRADGGRVEGSWLALPHGNAE